MKFTRQDPPVKYADYHRYREYTRRDFQFVCAHCFRHEDEAGGEEHFVQDHFEPKHRRNVDPADYFSLYWSCVGCNGRKNKGSKWPTSTQLARGEKFCDPCDHDPVGTDYIEKDDGMLQALTPAGAYTNRVIRLNERRPLVNLRLKRRRNRQIYMHHLAELRGALQEWKIRLEERPDEYAKEKCSKLAQLIGAYDSFVNRDLFMLCHPFPPEVPDDVIVDV